MRMLLRGTQQLFKAPVYGNSSGSINHAVSSRTQSLVAAGNGRHSCNTLLLAPWPSQMHAWHAPSIGRSSTCTCQAQRRYSQGSNSKSSNSSQPSKQQRPSGQSSRADANSRWQRQKSDQKQGRPETQQGRSQQAPGTSQTKRPGNAHEVGSVKRPKEQLSKQAVHGSNSPSDSSQASSVPSSIPLPAHPVQVLVIGGGAAGLTAAYFAAQAGAQVHVLERTREAGKKILMSGGSRCNVLPLEVNPALDFFTSSSIGALRAIFAGWTLQQCHDWLSKDVGLRLLLEKETNKWFPASNSSREVRDKLVAACQRLGVRIYYNASVENIVAPDAPSDASTEAGNSSNVWTLRLANNAEVKADRLIVSTGGRSFPAVGTDGTGLNILQALGHKLVPQYAALTPLKGGHPAAEQLAGLTLAGVCLSVTKPGSTSKIVATAQRGGLLFTHKGYSGPATLDLSHWLVRVLDEQQQQQHQQQQQQQMPGQTPRLLVNWCGEGLEVWQQRLAEAQQSSGSTTVESLLRKAGVKERLAAALAAEVGVSGRPLAQLKKTERAALLNALTAWELPVTGHEGYKKAEVTGGGVLLQEIDSRTMESRVLPSLYLCGEVLDVFGRIGGFNFYWAWLTGRLAGLAAAAAAVEGSRS